jgi:hypothetical protein
MHATARMSSNLGKSANDKRAAKATTLSGGDWHLEFAGSDWLSTGDGEKLDNRAASSVGNSFVRGFSLSVFLDPALGHLVNSHGYHAGVGLFTMKPELRIELGRCKSAADASYVLGISRVKCDHVFSL